LTISPTPADRSDDNVSPPTPDETKLLEDVAKSCGRSVDELVKVWRQPSFSIANISSSGVSNKTVIPKKVSADISMRIVPEQVGGALPIPEDLVPRRKLESSKTHCDSADAVRTSKRLSIRSRRSAGRHSTRSDRPTTLT
jgi:hypothetical protein